MGAELQWSDHENRSLSERADAAVKLKDILPPQALAEYVLGLTAEQISKIQSQRAGDVMSQLLAEAAKPAPGTIPSALIAGEETAPPAPTPVPAGV